MKDWIAKLSIYLALLYILFIGNHYAEANELSNIYIQPLNTIPIIENLSNNENYYQENHKEDFRRFREIIREKQKLEGFFTLYRDQENGQVYWEIKPEQLNKTYLGIVTLESGLGEKGIYSGLPLDNFLFYLRRVNNNLHFVIRNVKFRAIPDAPEQRSLARSFSESVLHAVKIITIDPYSKNLLVNLGDLLMQDFPGLIPLLQASLETEYYLEANRSYFSDIKSFPLNTEIDTNYGFSSPIGADLVTVPDSRALSLQVHYSFSELPANNGYIPRLADERVGYFITAFQDFSAKNQQEPFIRYINRWHLEPSISDAPLSPPKKPIVFWIDNTVPLEYRNAVRQGVLMWNKAFEKAGFFNAIEVRQMPDDADWHPADVRYNTISWFHSLDAGFAKALVRVNPLSGEILDADIVVDAGMVRSIQQNYHSLVNPNTPALSQNLCEQSVTTRKTQDDEMCYGMESSFQASLGALALSLLPDTTPSADGMQKYIDQYVSSLIAHEVGHTLGLRHNFQGSTMLAPEELNNTEITHTKGLTGSVMDYLPVNIAPPGVQQGDYFPTVVGPYDEWAIEYGYRYQGCPSLTTEFINPVVEKPCLAEMIVKSPQPELSYATDEDIWDINPLANVWDMSSDVLTYSQWQMDNARSMWQHLDQRHLTRGESYGDLRVLFNRILKYYFRNAALLTQYIGGQSFQRHHVDDFLHWTFEPVSREKQLQALTKLQKYIFSANAFDFSPHLLNRLAPSRWRHWGNSVPIFRLDYPIHQRILSFQSAILRSLLDEERLNRLQDIELKSPPTQALSIPELFDSLQKGIWTEILDYQELAPISSIRRSLQREHLNLLISMVLRLSDVPEDGRTIAWYELRQLKNAIQTYLQQHSENLDIYTLAHLEETSDRISKALDSRLLAN